MSYSKGIIYVLFAKPKDDLHKKDFVAVWTKKPSCSEIKAVISENQWNETVLSEKECKHVLRYGVLDYGGDYWQLEEVKEGIYSR